MDKVDKAWLPIVIVFMPVIILVGIVYELVRWNRG